MASVSEFISACMAGFNAVVNQRNADWAATNGRLTAAETKADNAAIAAAAATIAAGSAAKKAANLGDLTSPAVARSNLGLTAAASLPVNISGGLALYDDPRIGTGGGGGPDATAAKKNANLGDLTSHITARANLRIFVVNVHDHGDENTGNGTADDVVALQLACNAASALGGCDVKLNPAKRYKILGANLTVTRGVCIRGNLSVPGVPGNSNADLGNLFTLGSRIDIATNRTIILKGSSGVQGVFLCRHGMVGQELGPMAYAGTAITVEGEDTFVRNCFVIGFNRFWLSDGTSQSHQRAMVEHVRFDTINGLSSINAWDIPLWDHLHKWPFGTFGTLGNASASAAHMNSRNGVAYELLSTNDWFQMHNCFDYGTLIGFRVAGPQNVHMTNCMKDNLSFQHEGVAYGTPGYTWVVPGSKGFEITGVTDELKMIGCQVAATEFGWDLDVIDSTANITMTACTAHGVHKGLYVGGGNVKLSTCWFRAYGNGQSSVAGLWLDGAGQITVDHTTEIEGFPVAVDGGNVPGGIVGMPFVRNGTVVNVAMCPVAVAGGLAAVSAQFHGFIVTGTPGDPLGTLGAGAYKAGETCRLLFAQNIAVLASGNIHLSGGQDRIFGPDEVLTLMWKGTYWVEVSRSVLSAGASPSSLKVRAYITSRAAGAGEGGPIYWNNLQSNVGGWYNPANGVFYSGSTQRVSLHSSFTMQPTSAAAGRLVCIMLRKRGATQIELGRANAVPSTTYAITLNIVVPDTELLNGDEVYVTYFTDNAANIVGTDGGGNPISFLEITGK